MTRSLVVTADDYGLTQSISDSILETVDAGAVTNVSIMPNGMAFEYALAEWQKRQKFLLLSIHINLTEGKPVSSPHTVPLLVKKNSTFKYSVGGLWFAYLISLYRGEFRRQVRLEIEAQIKKVKDTIGTQGTIASINGHQHVHMVPFIFDELVAVSGVTSIRVPHEVSSLPSVGIALVSWRQIFGWIVLSLLCWCNKSRVQVFSERFAGVLYSGRMTLLVVVTILQRMSLLKGSSLEILFHPGLVQEGELTQWHVRRANSRWYFSSLRDTEHNLLLSTEFQKIIKEFRKGTLKGSAIDPLKMLRFIIVGVLAASTHVGLLYFFTEYVGLWYILSTTLGWCAGFIVSFTLQKFWTFTDNMHDRVGWQMFLYSLLQGSNLVFNGIALFVLSDVLSVWYLPAQVVVLLVLSVWTYIISQRFIFKHSPVTHQV